MNRRWGIIGLLLLLGLLSACRQERTVQINLFYTAGVEGFYYSRPEPRFNNEVVGGYAVLKAYLDKQTVPFLLFDGGNWFGAAPESAMTQGQYMTPFLQALPYDAGTVCEDDFKFGWPALRGVLREQKFPFIVSNLTLENKVPWPMHDYQIFTREGIKIGVFGLVNLQVVSLHKSRLSGFSVQDPVERAREMVSLLREKGVDYIIVLSSLGEETQQVTDASLAGEVSGIDLILSSNQGVENAAQETVNNTHIIYPASRLDSVAHLTLVFDVAKRLKKLNFEDVSLSKEIYGEEDSLSKQISSLRETTRKKMAARLTQSTQEVFHTLSGESKLGNLLSDCLHRWAKLDGAILNSDSLRSPLPKGEITEYDLYNTYPYGDNITFITIHGKDFIRALEASLEAKDNFPQVAGFTVQYYPEQMTGKRIKQVTLANGRIVRPTEKYRFAITDHVLAGGFGHDLFINSLEFKNTFVEARQIMRTCLIRQKTLNIPALGRWKQAK